MELADPKYKFDDTFTVKSMDNEKFAKVPRVVCEGNSFGASLEMDFYFDSFSLKEGDQFFMALTDSVSTVQRADEGVWDQSNEPSVIDHFDHVMYGKLYKKEDRKQDTVAVYISFGGLLCKLEGGKRELESLTLDQRLYVLIKRS